MSRGVIYPEDMKGHSRQRSCQLSLDFGLRRGFATGCGVKQERLQPLPFDGPERMAYYRGYSRGYAKGRMARARRNQHGT